MQIQPLWAYDLIDHVQFWQTEQGFDTIDIHEQGSFFWVTCFLECCEESCACQQPLSVPCYQAQTLASNLAKSPFIPRKMVNAGTLLNYNLYTDAARTTVWGDGTGGTVTVSGSSNGSTTHTVYGRI